MFLLLLVEENIVHNGESFRESIGNSLILMRIGVDSGRRVCVSG